mgnify:CR=1 FL=1|tara:strand:- start:896 stop:1285 length:390 start_codon:yes stop_codon:yes gene_type:complete
MILRLKKKTNNARKTLSNKIKSNNPFKKSKIVIFDDVKKNTQDQEDSDDDMPINTNKLSSIIKEKINGESLKKSVASNANLVREMLMKTVDKHKVEICGQMAQQIVEIYNKRQDKEDKKEESIDKDQSI